MGPLKNTISIFNTNLISRRTQFIIFTSFILTFSLLIMILLISPMTSNCLPAITITTTTSSLTSHLLSSASSTSTNYFVSSSSLSSSFPQNGSGLVIAAQKIEPIQNGSNLVTVIDDDDHQKMVRRNESGLIRTKKNSSCDLFDGKWVFDPNFDPVYPPGSCPYIDYAFNCFENGRSDLDYLKYRWQPHGCDIPRFDGKKMLKMLRGKRMVFVGDSLNRNMWESLVCALRMSVKDKRRVFEVSGRRQFRTEGFYSFKFKDYDSSIEFIRSPFLVQQWKKPGYRGKETPRETLRLDMIQASTSNYYNADYLIFNTGHWWTHHKTRKGENFFQEGDHVYRKLKVTEAYSKALHTWAKWVDKNVNKNKTQVFFTGYSSSHFRGGQWNSGGSCNGEKQPIKNDKYLAPYPWMMKTLESVMSKMRTKVVYLNITKLTDYRKDGHPSVYREPGGPEKRPDSPQDCSHWCLPGVPDSWNQLLYASLLLSSKGSSRSH